jgi:LuxR family maltose regulon positive regulatory protein
VEVLNLLALLSFQENHAILAYRHMDESLDIGIQEGYIRSYLDELLPMAQLLRAYIKSRRRQDDEQSVKERKLFAGRLLKQMRVISCKPPGPRRGSRRDVRKCA